MTVPMMPAAPPGYRQMGGGYDAAITEAQQRAGLMPQQQQWTQQGNQQVMAQQFSGQQLPPQMMQGQPPIIDSVSPLQQLQQIQQQVPVQQQQVQQQPVQQQQPVRFGDMPRNLQQFAASQFAQQQLPGNGLPPQQQIQAPQGIDINTRLTGPGIPPSLQGRTLGEAISIHNGLQQAHIQLMSQQQPSTGMSNPPVQTQPQVQHQAGTQQGWDWRDPAASVQRTVQPLLEERFNRLEAALAPAVQQSSMAAIQSAMNQAAQEIGPQFTQFGPAILQRLQGADPRALTNPQVWKLTAESVIGAAALQAGRQQPQNLGGGSQPPGMYPAQAVQPGQQPLPNLNSFFVEQPYQGGQGAQGAPQLTPQQMFVAQQMGIAPADYAAWYLPTRGGQR